MSEKKSLSVADFLIFSFFLFVVAGSIAIVLSGAPYVLIDYQTMSFWLLIIVPVEATFAGIILTYSLAQYTITKQFRDLVLIFMAVNMILDAFLYILSNEAFMFLSPFADRERNRTVVIAFGFILAPSVLLGTLSQESATERQRNTVALWGGFIVPSISLWFFLSPTPVFITTPVGMGIEGFTPIAWMAFIGVPICMILAISKFLKSWQNTRNRLDLASGLALSLWFLAVLLFSSQTNPQQLMELIWYSVFALGTFLITAVSISISVIEPRKRLTLLVNRRTHELDQSRKESEFYLNIWGHKIGNLLQSMMLYLEMLSMGDKPENEIKNLVGTALDIGRETDLINKQVAALIRIKQLQDQKLQSVNISEILRESINTIENVVGVEFNLTNSNHQDNDLFALADNQLDLVFVNLFTHICREGNMQIQVHLDASQSEVSITTERTGRSLPEDVRNSLLQDLQPTRTSLSLDLFTVRLLMSRYRGKVEYSYIESSQMNQFRLIFKKAPSSDASNLVGSKTVPQVE